MSLTKLKPKIVRAGIDSIFDVFFYHWMRECTGAKSKAYAFICTWLNWDDRLVSYRTLSLSLSHSFFHSLHDITHFHINANAYAFSVYYLKAGKCENETTISTSFEYMIGRVQPYVHWTWVIPLMGEIETNRSEASEWDDCNRFRYAKKDNNNCDVSRM